MAKITHTILRIAAGVLLLVIGAGLVRAVVLTPENHLRDFSTYYYASLARSRGENPYDAVVSTGDAGASVEVKFVYPPHVLPLFAWTVGLPLEKARIDWLIIKILFLAALLLCWRTIMAKENPGVVFYAFAAVAFNSAILIDFTTGNIAVIEQALLWGGFIAYCRGRWLVFALLVAASALFKVANGLFLLLLLVPPSRKSALPFAAGVLGAAIPLLLSAALWPELFSSFLVNARGLVQPGEPGATNPCMWAFLGDMRTVLSDATGWDISPSWVPIAFALNALFVAEVTFIVLTRLLRSKNEDRFLFAVSLASLAFPLVVPRFKDYSFIQLIPPAYLLLRRAGSGTFEIPLLLFLLCMPSAAMSKLLAPLPAYHLVFVTYGLWVMMVVHLKRGEPVPEKEMAPPLSQPA